MLFNLLAGGQEDSGCHLSSIYLIVCSLYYFGNDYYPHFTDKQI